MVNYQNAKIYRLVCDDPNLVYYGATAKKYLCSRLAEHKYDYKNGKVCTSRHLFEVGNVQIFLVENFPCDSKEQLNARERYWIENNECVNKKHPGRTLKESYHEWYQSNKEQKRQRDLEYRKNKKHCDVCDLDIDKQHFTRHTRSKKHIALVNDHNRD
jgi:hypothetical protein